MLSKFFQFPFSPRNGALSLLVFCLVSLSVNCQNLIVNGDFGTFNSAILQPTQLGYQSNYNQINYNAGNSTPRQFAITNNPNSVNTANYKSIFDHTTGDGAGNMMVVDGQNYEIFWKQNPDRQLQGGQTYTFSFWIINVNNVTNGANPAPVIQFNPNCSGGGCAIQTFNLGSLPAGWNKITYTITPATTQYVRIELSTVNAGGGGNDFAIDDISLIPPPQPLTISNSLVNPSCPTSTDGVIVAYPNGGVAPFTYTLAGTSSATNSTGIFQGLAAGSYTVSVTDSNTPPTTKTTSTISVVNPVDITLSATPTGCILAGTAITLTAANGGATYGWSASTGIPITDTDNVANVTPLVTTTYTVTSTTVSPTTNANLIRNPSFENGTSGFYSDYTYSTTNTGGAQFAYGIVKNANTWFSGFISGPDHSGSGFMLVADGATSPNSVIWSQTVPVETSKTYTFSFWVQALVANSPAQFQVLINGSPITISPISPTNGGSAGWNQISGIWNSGVATIATIKIIDTNIASGGNDFALDDISFSAPTSKSCNLSTQITVSIGGSIPITTFSYTTPVCKNATNPSPTGALGFVTGGTYSDDNATGLLSINSSTGVINLSASASGTYTIRYSVVANPSICQLAGSSTTMITINSVPTVTASPNGRCGAGTVTLGATSSSGTINWYANSTGGTSIGTGTSFTTPNISADTTYWIDATDNGCTTTTRTSVLASVGSFPSVTTSPNARCGTGTVILGATASSGTINWYAASTGGSSLSTGTSFTTPSISSTTTYWVDATNNGCTSPTRTSVLATINPLPTITSTTPGSRCGTGTVTLGATSSSGIINWYAASTGGSSLGTGTSFTTPSISSTTTYWVEAVDGSCISSTRTSVEASVVSSAPLPTVAPVEYCQGSSAVALTATPLSGATLNWYGTNATGGTASSVAPIPSTTTVGNTTYYVSQTVGSCESARASIVVKVVGNTGGKVGLFCDNVNSTTTSVALDWSNPVGWAGYTYSYSIAGGPLVTGTHIAPSNFTVPVSTPGTSVTFTISSVLGLPCAPAETVTCFSKCSTTVAPNFAIIPAICSGATPVPTLATTSPNAITGSWSPSTIDNTTSQSYVFTPDPTSFPCASKQTLNVTVNSKVTPTFTGIPSSLCQGASAPVLPTTSSNSITGTWSPSSVDTSIVGTTTYTFTPTTGLCAVSNSVTITINPNVTPSFSSVGPICSGTTLSALPTTSTNTITGTWSPALNNAATTTYTFTPTVGQCATTNTLTITVNPKVIPSFAPVNPICSGDVLNALPTTSTNAITGTWSPALNNTTTTTYTFTPTAGLCANTATLIITVNQKVVPAFAPVAPICSGGTLSALPTTSTNGIIGSWTPALNNTATTTYTFTPNTGQCATTTTLSITVNPIVTPSFSAVGPICFGTTLSALPTTSTNAITGAWSPALNNTATTTYTFTPTAGQCATTNTLTITVNPKITPSFASVAPICSGDTLNALPTTSTNAITGTWSPALNNTATTTYTFTPTAGLCATTAVVTIVVNQKAVPAFASVAPICSGSTLSALPTTSTNGITGSWSPALDNTATTSYTFTPTAGLCATTAVVTITVNQKAVPTFTAVAPICSGATLSALPTTSSNGITGTWSPALNNTTTTTYTFTPNIGQCATTTTLTITVNPVTTPTFSSIGPLCSGTVISLPTTSINGIEGSWSPAFNPSATTTYTFTPGTGQCATTTKLTITIIALPIATATPKDSSLCSDTATSISLSSNTTGTTYLWNVVQTNVTGALAGSGDTIVQTLKTAVENKSGEAVYSITPTANGCPGLPILATVTVNPIPDVTANPSPATVCSGERTAIVLSSKVAGTTFSWTTEPLAVIGSFPDTGSTIAQTLVTNSVIPGTVDYTITPTAATCVGLPITVTVTVNPTPEVFGSGGTIICSGESTNIILSPKILGTDFTWTVVQDGVTGAEDGGGSNTIDQVLEAGTTVGTAAYTITPILNGCKGNPITIVITVNPSPQPVLEDGIICVQEATGTTYKNYLLDTGLSDSLYDFNWFKESVKISGASESTYEATAEGLYSVIATNTITSCVSQEVYATVIPNYPGLSLTTIVTDAFTPEATISVDVLGGTGPFLYRLDDGPLQSSNVFVGVSSGVHKVWVEDGQGCTNLSREVTVIDYPRYFTPNGDGFNDSWNVVGLNDQPEAKIYIFDRYGKLLKQISTIGEGWNGTFNGHELPATDYWFTIEYLENNSTKVFKAHFALKR